MKFHVEAMTCGGCARAVTAAIRGIDPSAEVRADPPTHAVEVQTTQPEDAVREVLAAAGFPAR